MLSFQELPEAIRTWLTSNEVTDVVVGLNKQFSVRGEKIKVISRIGTRLVIGAIKPEEFLIALKNELELPEGAVQEIAGRLKGEVFKPIADGLKNVIGVDIDKIPVQAKNINTPPKQPAPRPIQDVIPVTSIAPALPATNYKLQADKKPFMLHEETPVTPLPAQPAGQRESFSFHVPINYKPETRPAPAKFGASFEEQIKKPASPPAPKPSFAGDKPKVVHYHSYRSFPFLTEKKPLPPQK